MITTTVASQRAIDRSARKRWTVPAGLALGLLGGAALGVLARLWMRLISTDPEFTWPGTIAIVVVFALFGLGQASSWTARRRSSRRSRITAARTLGAVLGLGIFGAGGAIMLPTVLAGALAAWRTDWPPIVRALAALAALPVAVLVVDGILGDLGWGLHGVSGVAAFVGIYGVVIVALAPTVAPLADGWRMNRRTRIGLIVAPVVLGALFAVALLGG